MIALTSTWTNWVDSTDWERLIVMVTPSAVPCVAKPPRQAGAPEGDEDEPVRDDGRAGAALVPSPGRGRSAANGAGLPERGRDRRGTGRSPGGAGPAAGARRLQTFDGRRLAERGGAREPGASRGDAARGALAGRRAAPHRGRLAERGRDRLAGRAR